MGWNLEAACSCNRGKCRSNNEDNFYFDGKCLEEIHDSLPNPAFWEGPVRNGLCMAVFDGMGGASFGESASFAAARQLQQTQRKMADFFLPERAYLSRLVQEMNLAVVSEAREKQASDMGTTLVALYFSGRRVYVCNVGDSRAYRLRSGEFLQISLDHVSQRPAGAGKAPLSQCLGIDPEEMSIEPYIAKGEVKRQDVYLLCSDGLTDMLSNFEIADILLNNPNPEEAVRELEDAALERGGRDNITCIVCRVI